MLLRKIPNLGAGNALKNVRCHSSHNPTLVGQESSPKVVQLSAPSKNHLQHYQSVLNTLKTYDPHSYLLSRYILPQSRAAWVAVRAFGVLLARVDDDVGGGRIAQSGTTTTLRRMRYQWWRDGLKKVFEPSTRGEIHQHPVLSLLATVPQLPALSPYYFTRLIKSQEEYSINPYFNTIDDLAEYANGTQGSLGALEVQIVQAGHHQSTSKAHRQKADYLTHSIYHLSMALGIQNLLRGLPHDLATYNRQVIPGELARDYDLTLSLLQKEGRQAEGVRECVRDLANFGRAELGRVEGYIKDIDEFSKTSGEEGALTAGEKGILLRRVCVQNLFDEMERVDWDTWILAAGRGGIGWKDVYGVWKLHMFS